MLLVRGAPQEVDTPLNPGQFNYKAFLANKNIHQQQNLRPLQYQKVSPNLPNPLLYHSILLRRQMDNILREGVGEKREYTISSALILGVKDELDNSIRQAYTNTGTMHVLAVSGLHVGYCPLKGTVCACFIVGAGAIDSLSSLWVGAGALV